MANKIKQYYWDTSIFIEYFTQDAAYPYLAAVNALHQQAKDGRIQICTSVITITEVTHLTAEFVGSKKVNGRWQGGTFLNNQSHILDNMWNDFPAILLIGTNKRIAMTARDMRRWALENQIKGIQPVDALHIATAMFMKAAEIHTTEKDWFPYSLQAGMHIGFPVAPPLPPRPATLLDQ